MRIEDNLANTLSTKQERLETRIDSDLKELVQYAANLRGETITAFVTRALSREAEETIASHHIVRLSAEDSLSFVKGLFEESEPNENLKRAARRHQEWKSGKSRE
jgi:uncharacterized protein (DUF1778 family)